MSRESSAPVVRQVVAGVIERDGKVLIGQRKRTGSHPYKWEFPGGKVEPGESPHDATVRELEEELGIHVTVGGKLDSYQIQYGTGPRTELIFFAIDHVQGEPQNLDFEQILWVELAALGDYDFLEGDAQFLKRYGA